MFHSHYSQSRKEMERLLDEVQMNLENNYKDLAIGSLKIAVERIQELKNQELLKDKDYEKFIQRIKEYQKRMEGYSHRLNIHF